MAVYRTDPALVAAVLPKPLEPTDRPHVRIDIAEITPAGSTTTFGIGVASVACRHGEVEGFYDLFMAVTDPAVLIVERERFGSPAKLGQVVVERSGERVSARMGRDGVNVVELTGTVAERLPPPKPRTRSTIGLLTLLDPSGDRFAVEPMLVRVDRYEDFHQVDRIKGVVTLREMATDPIVDLPVRSIYGIQRVDRTTTRTAALVETVPGSGILPFVRTRST